MNTSRSLFNCPVFNCPVCNCPVCPFLITAFLLLTLATGVNFLTAATIFVPDDHATIQGAINAAGDGDEVIVRPGTYGENIDFLGKDIAVRGEQGVSVTTIDGNQAGSVVTFQTAEGVGAVLEGFTVTNGNSSYGGGIYCDDSSPTITGNTISGNSAGCGGGIYCDRSYTVISNNRIEGNTVTGSEADGGGIYHSNSSPAITGNIVSGNIAAGSSGDGGGIYCYISAYQSYPLIAGNVISGNSANNAGGIYTYNSDLIISNNCLSGNSAGNDGGGFACYYYSWLIVSNTTVSANTAGHNGGGFCFDSSSAGTITNTILWKNSAQNGPEIHSDSSTDPVITYCDVEGSWPGTGNINADPMFITGPNGAHYLEQNPPQSGLTSPCVDAGDPTTMCGGTTRTDLERDAPPVDMGFHSPPISAATIYVPDDYTSIQTAVDASWAGDRVFVRAGTYYENIDYHGKSITIESESGPEATVIDAGGTGNVVLVRSGELPGTTLSGFTLTNGSADSTFYLFSGGGIYLANRASLLVNNCIIKNNDATSNGGGIWLFGSSPNLEIVDSQLLNNTAGNGGGAIAMSGSSSAGCTGCLFSGNSSYYSGGCIDTMSSGSPTLTEVVDCVFIGNRSNFSTADGGAIQCGMHGTQIKNCLFFNNTAPDEGGALYLAGQGSVTDCWFEGNRAQDGASIYQRGWNTTISGCVFVDNTAQDRAGGIYFEASNSDMSISDCLFVRNAGQRGGGVYSHGSGLDRIQGNVFVDNLATMYGGAIYAFSAHQISQNSMYNNHAPSGSAIALDGYYVPEIYNNIMAFNTDSPAFVLGWGSTGSGDHNLYYQNQAGNYGGGLTAGAGDMQGDPLFNLPASNDLRLLWGSAAIDNGRTSVTDPDGTVADMGAFFFDQSKDIALYLTLDDLFYSPGASVTFSGTFFNRGTSAETLHLVLKAITPSGSEQTLLARSILLSPQGTAPHAGSGNVDFPIPASVQPGIYTIVLSSAQADDARKLVIR